MSLRGGEPPPPSPYYQAHFRSAPSRPMLLFQRMWLFGALVAVVTAAISFFAEAISPMGPAIQDIPIENRCSLFPPLWGSPPKGDNGTAPGSQRGSSLREKLPEKLSPAPAQTQVGIPLGMNLTRRAEPYWQGLRELLLLDNSTAEAGGWFDDANDDTERITEMWSKVERPMSRHVAPGSLSIKEYTLIGRDIHVREATLNNASVEFSWFLGNRSLMAQEFIRKGGVFSRTATNKLVAAGFADDHLKGLGPRLQSVRGHLPSDDSGNITKSGNNTSLTLALFDSAKWNDAEKKEAATVARNVNSVMRELVRQHRALVAPLGHPGVGAGGGGGVERICYVTLPAARTVEARFVKRLASASSQGGLWQARNNGNAIRRLEEQVCELHRTHTEVRRALMWLEERFPALLVPDEEDIGAEEGGKRVAENDVRDPQYLNTAIIRDGEGRKKEVPELLIWVQSAVELLNAWSTVLMDIQEGLLIAMRKRELRQQEKAWKDGEGERKTPLAAEEDYERSWRHWKQRNCGATSCYERTSALARLKHFFVQERPLAVDAWDEHHQLGWDVEIWKGVYEEACCGNGTLATTLKYGGTTPQFAVQSVHEHMLQDLERKRG